MPYTITFEGAWAARQMVRWYETEYINATSIMNFSNIFNVWFTYKKRLRQTENVFSITEVINVEKSVHKQFLFIAAVTF